MPPTGLLVTAPAPWRDTPGGFIGGRLPSCQWAASPGAVGCGRSGRMVGTRGRSTRRSAEMTTLDLCRLRGEASWPDGVRRGRPRELGLGDRRLAVLVGRSSAARARPVLHRAVVSGEPGRCYRNASEYADRNGHGGVVYAEGVGISGGLLPGRRSSTRGAPRTVKFLIRRGVTGPPISGSRSPRNSGFRVSDVSGRFLLIGGRSCGRRM
jgi:hypothetical protein